MPKGNVGKKTDGKVTPPKSVNTLSGLETLKTQGPFALGENKCAEMESVESQLKRVRENLNDITDKFYPMREMLYSVEESIKLNGTITEAAFNKLYVKFRVKM